MPEAAMTNRRGATRRADVPREVLCALERGEIETVNLMEWLAADMRTLCRNVARSVTSPRLRSALIDAADEMADVGITGRLKIAGVRIARAVENLEHHSFLELATHQSDLVRQWACYAVNSPETAMELSRRLKLTCRFARDSNMSVREAAWMAFRPHLALELSHGVQLLKKMAAVRNDNVRRFSVEVSRPRSVWGSHIEEFKRKPHACISILDRVRSDDSRYVQLAAGNWLNDASKSQPDWVVDVCRRWMRHPDPRTAFIVKRALRTIETRRGAAPTTDKESGTRLRPALRTRRQAC